MKKVLVPVADGFEEIETVTIIDVLRRAGVEVVVAGLNEGEIAGAHEIRMLADCNLDEALTQSFDMLILPGGQPGVDNLRADKRVRDVVGRMNEQKKWIGAICAAPLVLRDCGLTAGLKLTSYPAMEQDLEGCRYEQTRVVTDGHIITSRGPGTAMEFALSLVSRLVSKAKADELAGQVLAPGG
ncbi:MAG: DJ-1/PfpI family protein [Candidatus Omnitrophota bacterium]|nr:DJ-1/PfpI family protein [Candidatus Omnitrophota bacterium]